MMENDHSFTHRARDGRTGTNAGGEKGNFLLLRVLAELLLALLCCLRAGGCTVVIVSSSASEDGRPLLFKNRDNSNAYLVDIKVEGQEGLKFIAQYALREETWEGPWSGFNEAGFCIANSLSYNYSGAEYASMNKTILDRALRQCRTAADFEALIDGWEKPMDTRGNFAVVDAQGNAVFYEVGPYGFTKYDANDPETAPEGFLVRTNYSLAGDLDRKVGEERRMAAEIFARETIAAGQMNGRYILQNLPRYLVHSNGTVLYNVAPEKWTDETKTDFDGYIPRYSSTNAMLIEGVKAGESPLLTVCWSITGPPVATVAVPLLMTPGNVLPEKATSGWLSERGQQLKSLIFPYQEEMSKYVDLSKLFNREETGILQRIQGIENEIIERGAALIADARMEGTVSEEALADYYAWLDGYIEREYSSHFDDILTGIRLAEFRGVPEAEWWDTRGMRHTTPSNFGGIRIGRQRKYIIRNK